MAPRSGPARGLRWAFGPRVESPGGFPMPHPVRVRLVLPILPVVALLVGAGAPPAGYVATRATAPIVVDGRLDDRAWADAPWTEDFVDIEGDRKPKPRFRTRAKMSWDDDYFY